MAEAKQRKDQPAEDGDIDWANVASEVGVMMELNKTAQAALRAEGGEQEPPES